MFTVPAGSVDGVTVKGAGLTTIWNGPDAAPAGRADPTESTTIAVNGKVPAAVGVPVITPLLLSVRPGGSEPVSSDQL